MPARRAEPPGISENHGFGALAGVYTFRMRRTVWPVLTLTCLSLLGLQLSGLHMHVNDHGYSGAPHGTHVHEGGTDPHEHEHETDVTIFELGTITSKHFFFLIAVAFSLVTLFSVSRRLTPIYEPLIATGRRVRWRPLLRAPPHPL